MKYLDITKTIFSNMKTYPSDPCVRISQFKSLKKGNSCNLSRLDFGSHTATHIDAPRHIFKNASSINKIRIKDLICEVAVINIKDISNGKFFKKNLKGILLKTKKDKTFLDIRDAKVLIKKKIKLIGIDRMSIENYLDKSHPVHRILLNRNIIVVEGLNLKEAKERYYKLICLPLKIKGCDGAPARAILAYS